MVWDGFASQLPIILQSRQGEGMYFVFFFWNDSVGPHPVLRIGNAGHSTVEPRHLPIPCQNYRWAQMVTDRNGAKTSPV